ncbi:MAG TPA: hypothetical protein VGH53_29435 [Streptosporangiaceae bacterium]
MGILKRSAMAVAAVGAACVIVAGGTIPALAAKTSGVRYAVVQDDVAVGGPNSTRCAVTVLSAEVSRGNPAYVSAMVENTLTRACTGWLQSSVNGGAWQGVSPRQRVPGGQGPNNAAWYKTGNYYAGPGTRIRACIKPVTPKGTAPTCSRPVSLAASSAKPGSDGTSVYYAHRRQSVDINNRLAHCFAYLNSSTRHKARTSHVNLILVGALMVRRCFGWLESSTNKGKTWEQATPTYSVDYFSEGSLEYAFAPAVADGTGHLVRACVRVNAGKKCTAAW